MQTIETLRSLGRIVGGKVLGPDGWSEDAVHLSAGFIGDVPVAGQRLDARGCVVLPGIVDFHGDAFERQIMPRPKVSFSLDMAMRETDRQLAANGITTALHGVTHSWEGGLRGDATARALFAALDRLVPRQLVEHKVHLRYEAHHLAGESQAFEWLSSGRVSLLAFNDHLPGMRRKPHKWQEWADRAETDLTGFEQRLGAAAERGAEVPDLIHRLAAQARQHRVPMASHDDHSISVREFFQNVDCRISEFPLQRDVAGYARSQGSPVVCGAPNVLRGGSHVGAPRAADLARDGLCSILASDYYYPAPLHAACQLAADSILPLEKAWALVSLHPAQALGLDDRGEIAVGKRADLLVLDVRDLRAPHLLATVSGGRIVYLAEGERLHA
jgi:alpha-D-ribose 1-methylphosphonate 5-triphosphate diphosphatase